MNPEAIRDRIDTLEQHQDEIEDAIDDILHELDDL